MGRSYAGILGLLALVVIIGRGWLAGGGVESTVWAAWLGLIAFAIVGFVCGQLAEWIVYDSVRSTVALELEQQNTTTDKTTKSATT